MRDLTTWDDDQGLNETTGRGSTLSQVLASVDPENAWTQKSTLDPEGRANLGRLSHLGRHDTPGLHNGL